MENKKKTSLDLLPKRKQEEIQNAKQHCISMGIEYAKAYNEYQNFKCEINTPEKVAAFDFMFNVLLEKCELGFSMSPIIAMLSEKYESEKEEMFLNYRDYHLMQEVIKNVKIVGKEMHIRVSDFMKAFNDDGSRLSILDEETKRFAKEYQASGSFYSKLCQKYEVSTENIDDIIDYKLNKLNEEAEKEVENIESKELN